MEKKQVLKNANTNEWKANEKQKKVIDFLTAHRGEQFTLAEISKAVGEELKSGTTNTLLTREIVISHKDARIIECPCCGHKRKVSTYEIK